MFACTTGEGCRPCSAADPVSDTVKVNPNSFLSEDKENCSPVQKSPQEKEAERRAAEDKQRLERERQESQRAAEAASLERQRKEGEAAAAAETERQRRAVEEAEQQARLEQELIEREAAEAETLRKAEEERRLSAQAAEELKQKQEAEARQQEAEEQKQLKAFLKAHGFTGANFKRTRMMKSKYPLHSAVKHKEANMVSILIKNGADPALKSSAGDTPQQLATKLNKAGSHDSVLRALN